MLLSRFWYAITALVVTLTSGILFIAVSLYNRNMLQTSSEALMADSSAVSWFLQDDARRRSTVVQPVALDAGVREAVQKAGAMEAISSEVHEKARTALRKASAQTGDLKFDVFWVVDDQGRVVAGSGDDGSTELGGYSLVADALHGWIRDDVWVRRERVLRVVATPIEIEVNTAPVGALIAGKFIDDGFARAVSARTGAAVAFYVGQTRLASAAPDGIDKVSLDAISRDLTTLGDSKNYAEKGRTEVRTLDSVGVVYGRMFGEAWDQGVGFAVGRPLERLSSPLDFFSKATSEDKDGVPKTLLLAIFALVAGMGMFFTWAEHSRPLHVFEKEVHLLAEGKIDSLQPSKFQFAYKKLAQDLNDGADKVVAKGGVQRKAANMEAVLGPMQGLPQMSAFSIPDAAGSGRGESPSQPGRPAPPRSKPRAPIPSPSRDPHDFSDVGENAPTQVFVQSVPGEAYRPPSSAPPPPAPPPTPQAGSPSANGASPEEMQEWAAVYEEFLAMKKQCGENTAGLTFEKFKGTLEKNRAALVSKHACKRVKFTVYAKEGKAALKASPVK